MWRFFGALVMGLALGCVPACGGDSERTSSTAAGGSAGSSSGAGGSGGSSSDAAPDREIDCSNVGCSPPPLCSEGCQAACGCCSCAEGDSPGNGYVCRGGCYASIADAAAAAWSAFAVRTAYGPCPPNQVCSSSWRVERDGSIAARKEGVDSAARMSENDLLALDAILKDDAFRRDMVDGFDCPSITDVFTTITLYAPDAQEQSVSGCVVNQRQTPVARAVALVTRY